MLFAHRVKRILALLGAFAVLAAVSTVYADNIVGIGLAIAPLLDELGLDDSNFAMGYYNPYTGEEWYYNGTSPMLGGSVYKLPLSMMYEERVNAGDLTLQSVIGGYTLEKAMYFMLVESNNDVAAIFEENLGTSRSFRQARVKYFGVEPEALPADFLNDNYFTAEYSIAMLRYLYENADSYPNVLSNMVQAQPGQYFRAQVDEFDIAHKYGYFEGYLNDVGVIYTPQPYLLAVYTYHTGEDVLGAICRAATDYTLTADASWTPPALAVDVTDTAAPTSVPAPDATPSPSPEVGSVGTANSMVYIITASSLALLLIALYEAAKSIKRIK